MPSEPSTFEHRVRDVRLGQSNHLDDGVLLIDTAAIEEMAALSPAISSCRVEIARPGDGTRLVHVLDSMRPVCSSSGRGMGAFPGLASPATTLGLAGDVLDLDGVLVTLVGEVPEVDSFLTQQEGILDLGGPGSELSPLADQIHVVLDVEAWPGTASADVSTAFRHLAAGVAESLASAAIGRSPDSIRAGRQSTPGTAGLHLAHICEVSAFGSMFDTLVAGRSVIGSLPTPISLSDLDSGAVVSADYHYAGQRNFTCHYQRSPIAEAVAAGFPPDEVRLATTILMPVGRSNAEKETGAAIAARLAAVSGADGVVVTAVAGGNAHLDVMFAVRECERRGMRAALSLVEMAGPTGADPGMVDTVPEADLVVSTGNREELVELPSPARVVGGSRLYGPEEEGGGSPSDGAVRVPLRAVAGVNNEMGAWRVGATAS